MKVLLVEPWYSGSHAAWADGYRSHSGHDVRLVTLPGRFWRWRLRGSAVELASMIDGVVADDGRPDVVLVSSLTDLATLLGLVRGSIGDTPAVWYLHENQLAYPRRDATDVDAAMRTWTSLLAADHLVFNSEYHRRVVADALPALGRDMPDGRVGLDPDAALEASTVIPVGVEANALLASRRSSRGGEAPLIVWNHRWDDDKQPEVFVRACQRLAAQDVDVRVALMGEDAWADGERRRVAARALGSQVTHCGHLDQTTYRRVLREADLVVSTARHEFFGVSIVEAVAAGCIPLLPDALSYPELIAPPWQETTLYQDGTFGRSLAAMVADIEGVRRRTEGLAESMSRFDWSEIAPRLDALLESVTRRDRAG